MQYIKQMQHKAVSWLFCCDGCCSGLVCGEYSLWISPQLLKAFIILLSCKMAWCIHTGLLAVAVPMHCCAAYGIVFTGVGVRPEGCLDKMSAHLGVVSWELRVLCLSTLRGVCPWAAEVSALPLVTSGSILQNCLTSVCLGPWCGGDCSSREVQLLALGLTFPPSPRWLLQ